jgi:hypothetical protein
VPLISSIPEFNGAESFMCSIPSYCLFNERS